MSVVTLLRGENLLLQRSLLQADGVTPLNVSALSALQVELLQAGKTVRTFVRGVHPELRDGSDGASVVLELTTAITSTLKPGSLTERWRWEVADVRFVVQPGKQVDLTALTEVVLE